VYSDIDDGIVIFRSYVFSYVSSYSWLLGFQLNSVDAGHQNRILGDEQSNDGIVDTLILIETNVQWNLSSTCSQIAFSQGPSRRPSSQILRKDRKDIG